jgi:hypothetical protein
MTITRNKEARNVGNAEYMFLGDARGAECLSASLKVKWEDDQRLKTRCYCLIMQCTRNDIDCCQEVIGTQKRTEMAEIGPELYIFDSSF